MNISINKLQIGAVVIGRNEGQRLVTCFESLLNCVEHIVYVDSGSSDSSLHEAKVRGIDSLSLDTNIPFTAARARNEGADYLIQKYSNLDYLQFIDGDCELQANWMGKAQGFLNENIQYAVVCGRRQERYPEQSIYNQLCDIEWNTPVGDTMACGGDALIRVDAFTQVDGFRNDLIAGEEPEMCFRLRQKGWEIFRLDAEMTLHDAAIIKFSQWWKRSKRGGHAFTEGAWLHGLSLEKYYVKESLRVFVWGLLIPFCILISSLFLAPYLFLMTLIYPLQIIRLVLRSDVLMDKKWSYAFFLVIGKFPEATGQLGFVFRQLFGRKRQLIEYK